VRVLYTSVKWHIIRLTMSWSGCRVVGGPAGMGHELTGNCGWRAGVGRAAWQQQHHYSNVM
jgi:hypothetical protein